MENDCFDCGGKGINNDFQQLLKSDMYPETLINLKEISIDNTSENTVQALLEIRIAGVTNACKVPIKLTGEDTLLVEGVLNLNICDFNLEPPKKALGLIVVKDIIEINFQLVVQEY